MWIRSPSIAGEHRVPQGDTPGFVAHFRSFFVFLAESGIQTARKRRIQ